MLDRNSTDFFSHAPDDPDILYADRAGLDVSIDINPIAKGAREDI